MANSTRIRALYHEIEGRCGAADEASGTQSRRSDLGAVGAAPAAGRVRVLAMAFGG